MRFRLLLTTACVTSFLGGAFFSTAWGRSSSYPGVVISDSFSPWDTSWGNTQGCSTPQTVINNRNVTDSSGLSSNDAFSFFANAREPYPALESGVRSGHFKKRQEEQGKTRKELDRIEKVLWGNLASFEEALEWLENRGGDGSWKVYRDWKKANRFRQRKGYVNGKNSGSLRGYSDWKKTNRLRQRLLSGHRVICWGLVLTDRYKERLLPTPEENSFTSGAALLALRSSRKIWKKMEAIDPLFKQEAQGRAGVVLRSYRERPAVVINNTNTHVMDSSDLLARYRRYHLFPLNPYDAENQVGRKHFGKRKNAHRKTDEALGRGKNQRRLARNASMFEKKADTLKGFLSRGDDKASYENLARLVSGVHILNYTRSLRDGYKLEVLQTPEENDFVRKVNSSAVKKSEKIRKRHFRRNYRMYK